MLSAFRVTACYLKEKLPLANRNLKHLSMLDPKMWGDSHIVSALNSMFDYIPIKITSKTPKDSFSLALSALQTDTKL